MTEASVCTIGDEILIGQIIDTNSARIAAALGEAGIHVRRMLSIGDSRKDIIENLDSELRKSGIVIVTGGLGPTKDDITKAALAELSGSVSYKEDSSQLEVIHRILESRGLDVLDINRAQAMVPDRCEVITNRLGTAPVMVFRFPDGRYGHKATLYSLPGVPFEAEGALPDIIDDICRHYDCGNIVHKTVMTYGLAESALSKKLEAWEDSLPDGIHLAYLPDPLKGVRLRLSAYGCSADSEAVLDRLTAEMKDILKEYVYADSDTTLQDTVSRLLSASGKTLSIAESCTGGMLSHLITSVPGCSSFYLGSVTSYAIRIKENVLGVPDDIIMKYGVVSSQCAAAMAEGVKRITGSDYSVATTGIAGPGGGSEETPVGLVWIGVCSLSGTETFRIVYGNDRKRNIERFSASALDILRKAIENDITDCK